MQRRALLVIGAAALAAPAIARAAPKLQWRLTSGFPRSLDTIFGASEVFVDAIRQMSDGAFEIQIFPAGEIVPVPQAAEAVGTGTIEMAHTASYYYWGKNPCFALATAVPFGLNARGTNAWHYHGGGIDLMNRFYAGQNLYGLPCGNTGAQMGGWFRDEIRSLADLAGVKMRIGGLGGQVMQRLGVVPQQIPGGDIYAALERGTIDAAEWVGPYDDEKLGFNKVAPYYYYPGFWEGGPMLHVLINKDKWDALPAAYQAIVTSAAAHANVDCMAKYDALNPAALRRLVGGGAQLRPYPQDVMEAAFATANTLYAEIGAANAEFKTIYDSMRRFRDDQNLWFQVSEYSFDTFQIRNRPRG